MKVKNKVGQNTQLPVGYKQSDLGLVPSDWQVRLLPEVVNYIHGKAHERNIVANGKYKVVNSKFISSEGKIVKYSNVNYCRAHKGDVLTVLSDLPNGKALAKCFFVEYDNLYAINQRVCAWRSKDADQKYLFYILNRNKYFLSLNDGVSQTHILNNHIVKCLLLLPTDKNEQIIISQALSDIDSLITGLSKLAQKKRNIKRGAMQELLAGKRRLPGFNEEWDLMPIKLLLQTPVTDGPHLTPKFIDIGIPFLSVNNLVNNKIDLTDLRHISKHDHLEFSKKCKPQRGDILMGKAASVGSVALVDIDLEFNIWSPLALLRFEKKHDSKYMYYALQTRKVFNQIKLLTNSSSQGNLGMGDIKNIELDTPAKKEQTSIAQVFSDMDAEVESLEKQKVKYIELKQGMMQQLLTGKIRLVLPKVKVAIRQNDK